MWELAVAGFVLSPILGLWSPPVLAPAQPPNQLTEPVAVYNMMIADQLILDMTANAHEHDDMETAEYNTNSVHNKKTAANT